MCKPAESCSTLNTHKPTEIFDKLTHNQIGRVAVKEKLAVGQHQHKATANLGKLAEWIILSLIV